MIEYLRHKPILFRQRRISSALNLMVNKEYIISPNQEAPLSLSLSLFSLSLSLSVMIAIESHQGRLSIYPDIDKRSYRIDWEGIGSDWMLQK